MNIIDRRDALKTIFGGAAAVGLGVTLLPKAVEAAPIALDKDLATKTDRPVEVEQAQWGPGPGPGWGPGWGGPGWGAPPPRRRRRWVCWWHRGRRVCGWRTW